MTKTGFRLLYAAAALVATPAAAHEPELIIPVEGLRASDLLTDLSYIAAVPSLTTLGWALLTPPAFLNAAFIVTMTLAFRRLDVRPPQ